MRLALNLKEYMDAVFEDDTLSKKEKEAKVEAYFEFLQSSIFNWLPEMELKGPCKTFFKF